MENGGARREGCKEFGTMATDTVLSRQWIWIPYTQL
jgi:hypothetical protein